MLTESESKISDRFLFTYVRYSKKAIDILQRGTQSRCAEREKTEAYFKYLDWKQNENEIALFTMYAYADLKIPKEFSCIFDLKNPMRKWECKMTLTQSIFDGWYPIENIEHGHKHLTVFKFEDKIPEIIFELYELKDNYINLPESYFTIGICQIEDYEKIKKYLITSEELKKKHGVNWVEFYNEE